MGITVLMRGFIFDLETGFPRAQQTAARKNLGLRDLSSTLGGSRLPQDFSIQTRNEQPVPELR